MENPRILVIGSVNMDLVARVHVAPHAGQTVMGTQYSYCAGGKGANTSVAAARLGGRVYFSGRVGGDVNGRRLRDMLKADGVDTRMLRVDPAQSTGLAVIQLEDDGQNRIIVFSGANASLCHEDLVEAFIREYDAVLLQCEIPLELLYEIALTAKEREIPIFLDTAPAENLNLRRFDSPFLVTPNQSEAYSLVGVYPEDEVSAHEASVRIKQMCGAEWVIIKMGDKGAYMNGPDVYKLVPAFPIRVVDSTAAGDTFTGALAVEYLRTGDMTHAVRYACAAGALCVSRQGAQPSIPHKDVLDQFMKDHP